MRFGWKWTRSGMCNHSHRKESPPGLFDDPYGNSRLGPNEVLGDMMLKPAFQAGERVPADNHSVTLVLPGRVENGPRHGRRIERFLEGDITALDVGAVARKQGLQSLEQRLSLVLASGLHAAIFLGALRLDLVLHGHVFRAAPFQHARRQFKMKQ